MKTGALIDEKTRVNVTLYVMYGILVVVIFATAFVVSFAGDTTHDISSLKSDKLESDTFAIYRLTQEYNQRELFKKVTLVNKKLDLLLKLNKLRLPESDYQSDSLELFGE